MNIKIPDQRKSAISVVIGFIVFVGIAIMTNLFQSNDLPVQITGALLEAVITALITYFLLTGQTAQEEIKERQVKIFEKKQEIYYNFLEKLEKIIQDGEVHIGTKNKDGSVNNSVDELKGLIFQFAYLQLHTSEETINNVVGKVSKIIQRLNNYNSIEEADKQKELPEFYSSLSSELFDIIAILKKDLYATKNYKPISKEKMDEILRECGLFVETQDFDKCELQNYFLDELQKLLIQKGYEIEQKDFRKDVDEYYSRAKNRHYGYGIVFPIKVNNKTFDFKIEMENRYFYGFPKSKSNEDNQELVQIIQKVSDLKKNNKWFGWKYPDRDLNFWELNSAEFERLKNPQKREKLLADIVEEIDTCIKKFIKEAQKL
jgi:hypothetical protein